jgi:hypothetical protein
MNKEQQDLLNEVYENYEKEIIRQRQIQKVEVARLRSQGKRLKVALIKLLSKEEFIDKIKTDPEFSERWGLKIEERELTPKERIELAGGKIQDKYPSLVEMSLRVCDERDIPTKLITITYNNKTIESYE